MDDVGPDLAWRVQGGSQSAYQVRAASSEALLETSDLWDSGKVASGRSFGVPWGGEALTSRLRVVWQVRVWDREDRPSEWSAPSWWEMGLLERADWGGARWIDYPDRTDSQPLPIFARAFSVDASKTVSRARLYVSGLGIAVGTLNGEPVTDEVLAPGNTNEQQSVEYRTYDVGGLVRGGENTLGVQLGNGTAYSTVVNNAATGRTNAFVRWRSVAPAKTTTTGAVVAGATDVPLTSITGFGVGQTINLNTGGGGSSLESRAITATRTATSTSLAAPVLIGDTNVKVLSVAGFKVGLPISVGTVAAVKETRTITAIGTAGATGTGITVSSPFSSPHSTGEAATTSASVTVAPALDLAHASGIQAIASGTDQQANASVSPRLIARLEISYADGSDAVIVSDRSWRTALGPTVTENWFSGTDYDATREQAGWDEPGADLSSSATRRNGTPTGWIDAGIAPPPNLKTQLRWREAEPVEIVDTFKPVSITQPTGGTWVFDLGQQSAGFVRLHLDGPVPAGITVRIAPAEMLQANGTVDQTSMIHPGGSMGVNVFDTYTTKGNAEGETWRAQFSYDGFQYVQLTGLPVGYTPTVDTITGLQTSAAAPSAGTIVTSSSRVNRINRMAHYSIMSNMLSIFTDCPNREKSGWLADMMQSMPAIDKHFGMAAYLRTTMRQMVESQSPNGYVPATVPNDENWLEAGWADDLNWSGAIILAPWTLYKNYGDTKTMARYWDQMKLHLSYITNQRASGYIVNNGLGDWAAGDTSTPAAVTGTSGYFILAKRMSQMAAALGEDEDAATYSALAQNIKNAYNARFFNTTLHRYTHTATGTTTSQADQALPLDYGMVPEGERENVLNALVDLIYAYQPFGGGPHTSGGTVSLGPIVRALQDGGRDDVLWAMLQEDTRPSYGYFMRSSVKHPNGQTTIPEYWSEADSQNHMILLQADEWFATGLAGIQQAAGSVAYEKVVIKPRVVGDLTHVRGSYVAPTGEIVSEWTRSDATRLRLEVTIPPNSSGEVWVSRLGGFAVAETPGTVFVRNETDYAVYEVEAGSYEFAVDPDSVLGNLGVAAQELDLLLRAVDELVEQEDLSAEQRQEILERLDGVGAGIDAARVAYKADDADAAASEVHEALAALESLRDWIASQTLSSSAGERLSDGIATLETRLGKASAAVLEAAVSLQVASADVVAGEVVRVQAVLENGGSHELSGVDASLDAPAGWTVDEREAGPATLAPGERSVTSFDVTVPGDYQTSAVTLAGTIEYRFGSGTARLPVLRTVNVISATELLPLSASPTTLKPGETTTITGQVRNRSSADLAGTLRVQVPSGWKASRTSIPFELAGGQQRRVVLQLTAPQAVTAGPTAIALANGDSASDRVSTTLTVNVPAPPATFLDYVDLGNSSSESSHGLTASSSSGTNTEAGRTRRYTNNSVGNGWFEFNITVEPGKPFMLRSTETYNSSQDKTYEVWVDGAVVHNRAFASSGAGLVTYQLLVPGSVAGSDGVVRVRFQDVPGGFDPSIADVWSVSAADESGGSVSGGVFEDADRDGVRESGEGPLAGFTVFVDVDGSGGLDLGEPTAVTGEDGAWSFADLAAGRSYVVREVLPAGWHCSAPVPCEFSVAVSAGSSSSGHEFLNWGEGEPTVQRVTSEAVGQVEGVLSLVLDASGVGLGEFVPGIGGDHVGSVSGQVTSTAAQSTLSVADASSTATGHLVNGSYVLASPLEVAATNAQTTAPAFAPLGSLASPTGLLSYPRPVSKDPVTVSFKQPIAAGEALRSGSYAKTVTFTLSTNTP